VIILASGNILRKSTGVIVSVTRMSTIYGKFLANTLLQQLKNTPCVKPLSPTSFRKKKPVWLNDRVLNGFCYNKEKEGSF